MRVLFLLLLPVFALAQRDFDYALYTSHARMRGLVKGDSSLVVLSLERRIVKEANHLQIINLGNTADVQEYQLQHYGSSTGSLPLAENVPLIFDVTHIPSLEYESTDGAIRFTIWPIIPLLVLSDPKTGKVFAQYY